MAQIFKITNGFSEGLMDGISDEEKSKTLKSAGVTIIYSRSGDRKVFLLPSINKEYSQATIKTGVCEESSMEELQEALKEARKVLGLFKP